MEITYKNKRLRKECTNFGEAVKRHGSDMAKVLHLRINQIQAAASIDELLILPLGNCHSLIGKRKGQYAMNLKQPFRLIFTIKNNGIQIAHIEEIVDYH